MGAYLLWRHTCTSIAGTHEEENLGVHVLAFVEFSETMFLIAFQQITGMRFKIRIWVALKHTGKHFSTMCRAQTQANLSYTANKNPEI